MATIEEILGMIERRTKCEVLTHKAKEETFNSSALGMPEEGRFYAQVIIPGYILDVELESEEGKVYQKTYHTNLSGTVIKEKK